MPSSKRELTRLGMSLERIRELRRTWFPRRGAPFEIALNSAFDAVGFSNGLSVAGDEGYITSVIAAHEAGRLTKKSKVVKDNVWGMVELDYSSMRLLDSPLVQRLRGIRQLGFTYLTYPSAEHSRFTHSLGMYAVVHRFLQAISRHVSDLPDENHGFRLWSVPPGLQTDLLHAALLHDIGHLPFSHVLERILESHPNHFVCGSLSVDDFRSPVSDFLGKELHLAECISLAIVLSPRFEEYYRRFVRSRTDDRDAPLRLAALIAGLPPKKGLIGAAALISGSPVDADKIDYVVRDASACGIPTGIDVARLFLRSAFLHVRRDLLTKLYTSPMDDSVIFVVNASGIDTVEELTQARSALYQRVYLHQTTRNAERLLGLCFEHEKKAPPQKGQLDLRDAIQLWTLDDFALLRHLANHQNRNVRKTSKRILNRDLPKRACVVTKGLVTTLMPFGEIFRELPDIARLFKEIAGAALDGLRGPFPAEAETGLTLEGRSAFEAEILEEAAYLAGVLRGCAPDHVPTDAKPPIVTFLAMPGLEEQRQDCIVLENNDLVHSKVRLVSDEQTEAADIFKSVGYVVTSPEWRVLVFLAARTVLYRRTTPLRATVLKPYSSDGAPTFDIRCIGRVMLDLREAVRRAGLNPTAVLDVQRAAERGGYFDDKPHLASDPDDSRIEAIAQNLGLFSGQGNWSVSAASCKAFIAQFPPRLRREMTDVLTNLTFLGRNVIAPGLKAAMAKLTSTEPKHRRFVCGLSPDSGNFVRMILEQELRDDLERNGWIIKKTIYDVFSEACPDDTVILCDDNMVSGSQAECQFMAWLGILRSDWAPDQKSEKGISDRAFDRRDQELFKAMRVGVAVCVGTQEADDRLRGKLASLGMTEFLGVAYSQPPRPTSLELSEHLRSFLAEVGADLLATCRYDKDDGIHSLRDEEKRPCLGNALGYGNKAGLVVTAFNVPVSTITALWCPGIARSMPWMPLALRRGYLQHLVLS